MTNREFKFHGALQKAESHSRYGYGREFRAIYDALMAVAHGIDAACEKLDRIARAVDDIDPKLFD